MSEAEFALCFEYGTEDAAIDLDKLLVRGTTRKVEPGEKKKREPRRGT
jgi:hypothetical protein